MGTNAWCRTGGASRCAMGLGRVTVVEAARDTTYAFPKKRTGNLLTVAFMNSLLKHFLGTLVGRQFKGSAMMPWIT